MMACIWLEIWIGSVKFGQGVSWKELAFFDGFCLVALLDFKGGELPFVYSFVWLARIASSFDRY